MKEGEEVKKAVEEAKAEAEERKKVVKAKEQKQMKLIRRLIMLLELLAFLVVGIYIFYPNADMFVLKMLSVAILVVSSWIGSKFTEFIFGKYEF